MYEGSVAMSANDCQFLIGFLKKVYLQLKMG